MEGEAPCNIAAVGEAGARELLDVLTHSESDRSALIGRLYPRADAEWLAEILTDLEEDEMARPQVVEALRFPVAAKLPPMPTKH